MEDNKRIRLVFKDDDILSEAQKSNGLDRTWVLLKPTQHGTISDVASHLLHAFQLHKSCPQGLVLSISGFVLPPFESSGILKDDEIIGVWKKKDVLSIAGNNAADEVKKVKAVEKQPVNTGVLLLANEEFEKEKGGYESDDPEEEFEEDDQGDLLEDIENAEPQNRKRKAPEKLQGSKKKKQRSEATGSVRKDVHKEKSEKSLIGGDLSNKKRHSCKEKNDDSDAEDSMTNNEKTANLSDKSCMSVPDMTRNVEVQENGKDTNDTNIAPKETKKVPSRSARRKYIKRRWLKEMAKIQKQNATCESEGLRNWKEDQAKAERKKVDGQSKFQQKWKRHQGDAEMDEVEDKPKGLLHLKISPQNNRLVKGKRHRQRNEKDYFLKNPNQNGGVHDKRNQNGNGHEQATQNGDGLEQPDQKQGDIQEQRGQESISLRETPIQNSDASKHLSQESDEENEVVPIVVRPGHIRFEPLGEEQDDQQNHVPSEMFQWNGITSKKKGQQWGKENRSFTPRNDYKHQKKEYSEILGRGQQWEKENHSFTPRSDNKLPNKDYSEILSNDEEKQPDEGFDFETLPPLPSIPKEGDVIAYRILELSSSWTPELSAYRVGKVSCYDAESNQTTLVPVPEYPIVSKKSDEDEAVQPDNSLYKEDGSLEIDFSSLIDVRIFKNQTSGPGNEALDDKQTGIPSSENGAVSIWDEVTEALNAKKEQLSKNGWGITPKKVQPPQESGWGKNAKKVQPSSAQRKNEPKVQPSQDNRWGKQSSGSSKPWSYKGLRGGGLASTMAMLRSRKDV